jgi:hypothetical protein
MAIRPTVKDKLFKAKPMYNWDRVMVCRGLWHTGAHVEHGPKRPSWFQTHPGVLSQALTVGAGSQTSLGDKPQLYWLHGSPRIDCSAHGNAM